MKTVLVSVLPSLLIVSLAVLAHAQDVPAGQPAREESKESFFARNRQHKGYGYFGLGVISGRISEDPGRDKTLDPGVHLLYGANRGHFGVELYIGTPEDNGFFGVGFKYNILPYNKYRLTPWIGIDGYALDILTNEDRGCFAPALGFDLRLAQRIAVRLGASECAYTEDLSFPVEGENVDRDITFFTLDMLLFFEAP